MANPSVTLIQEQDYRFALYFGEGVPVTYSDEPAPLGTGSGPTPGQLLVAAVANCLSDSLLFALRKFKQNPEPIRTEAHAEIGRNPENRLRILSITVNLYLGVPAAQLEHLDRVLSQFEAFCTVSQSVGVGIPITASVYDSDGVQVK
jgi:uncharacterized OsmC-like protein